MEMGNPTLPILRANRIKPDHGLDSVVLDGPLTFSSSADRAAFIAHLGLSMADDIDGGAPDSVYTGAGINGGTP